MKSTVSTIRPATTAVVGTRAADKVTESNCDHPSSSINSAVATSEPDPSSCVKKETPSAQQTTRDVISVDKEEETSDVDIQVTEVKGKESEATGMLSMLSGLSSMYAGNIEGMSVTSAEKMSAHGTCAQSTSAQSRSAQSTSAQYTSAPGTSAHDTSADSTSAQYTSAHDTSADSTSADHTCADTLSDDNAMFSDVSFGDDTLVHASADNMSPAKDCGELVTPNTMKSKGLPSPNTSPSKKWRKIAASPLKTPGQYVCFYIC